MYFRQTNPVFEKKNRNLDKQTAPYNTIKHQRDKQIFIVYRAGGFISIFKVESFYSYANISFMMFCSTMSATLYDRLDLPTF